MKREEVVALILSHCEGGSSSELTRFGGGVNKFHPVITTVRERTKVKLKPADLRYRTVGQVADKVMAWMQFYQRKH